MKLRWILSESLSPSFLGDMVAQRQVFGLGLAATVSKAAKLRPIDKLQWVDELLRLLLLENLVCGMHRLVGVEVLSLLIRFGSDAHVLAFYMHKRAASHRDGFR